MTYYLSATSSSRLTCKRHDLCISYFSSTFIKFASSLSQETLSQSGGKKGNRRSKRQETRQWAKRNTTGDVSRDRGSQSEPRVTLTASKGQRGGRGPPSHCKPAGWVSQRAAGRRRIPWPPALRQPTPSLHLLEARRWSALRGLATKQQAGEEGPPKGKERHQTSQALTSLC